MDDRWKALSVEFTQLGASYTPEQLADPDWCAKEIARKGYSVSFVCVTQEYVAHMLGKPPARPDLVTWPHWVYQLWGKHYKQRGAHQSPVQKTLAESAATALFNVCRLEWGDKSEGGKKLH